MVALDHSAQTDLATLIEKEKQLKSLADSSDKKIAAAKKVLAKLNASQRQQIADADKRAAARASRQASRSPINGSGKGAKALAFAKAQLGEPYARSGAGRAPGTARA